jgi:hypothetical protein
MRKIQPISIILSLLLLITASPQTGQTVKATNKIDPLPRDLEIQLALSALPPHLRDDATVYAFKPRQRF